MFSLRPNFSLIVTVTKVHIPTRLVWFLWEVKWERNDTSISFCREKPSAVFDNNWSIGNRHLKEGGVIEMIETNHLVFIFFYATLPPLCFFEYILTSMKNEGSAATSWNGLNQPKSIEPKFNQDTKIYFSGHWLWDSPFGFILYFCYSCFRFMRISAKFMKTIV